MTANGGKKVTEQVKMRKTSQLVWKYLGFSPDNKDEPVNMEEALHTMCLRKIVAYEQ